jgi:epoxyqueuosine reductase
MLSKELKARFKTDPAGAIRQVTKEFAAGPANRMPSTKEYVIYDEPIIGFADGNDPIFKEYKTIIASTHLTPAEAMAKAYDKEPSEITQKLTVISWILPITEETRKSNRAETKGPSRLWSHTRHYGEVFNEEMRRHVMGVLTELGYKVAAPQIQPYFKVDRNDKGPFSNWSERHIAYAAGLGTFSLTDAFITERGMAHRCGSVITDLVIPATKRTAKGHYDNCLFYYDGSCKACIERCPAGAITEKGHNKPKCQTYLSGLGYSSSEEYKDDTSVAGCGLCQTKVPCEYGIPKKIQKKRAK